jgi:hypothetical protein
MPEPTPQTPPVETAETGFNREEPRYGLVAVFGLATVVVIAILIAGLQFLYEQYREQQVFVKQQVPVWQDLTSLRAREDGQLHSYAYLDRNRGLVRIPIERAMELLAAEAAAGKLPYDSSPKPVPPPPPSGGGNAPAK